MKKNNNTNIHKKHTLDRYDLKFRNQDRGLTLFKQIHRVSALYCTHLDVRC